jgi:chromosome segregation ATPase
MNADESKTPKPDIESLVKPQEQRSIVEIVQNSIVEPQAESSIIEPQENLVIEPENQSSIVELEENSVIEPENQSSIINLQENSEDSAIEFLAELEQQLSKDEPEQLNIQEQALVAAQRVAQLQSQEQTLRQEIATLEANYQNLSKQVAQTQTSMGRVVQEALVELEQRKQSLQLAVEQLERRQERIRAEMRTSFAGTSQELAIRVQGFKDYLTGSLQDLAAAAEQLELTPKAKPAEVEKPVVKSKQAETPSTPQFAEQRFQSTTKQVRRLIDEYRTKPDYYGPPWQLRRTFEPVHAERVSNWFFHSRRAGRFAFDG